MTSATCGKNVDRQQATTPLNNAPPDAQALMAPSLNIMKPCVIIEFCTRVCSLLLCYEPVALTVPQFAVPMVSHKSLRKDTWFTCFPLRLHRATWTLTELMLTFPPPTLMSASLVPLDSQETSGRFRVWLLSATDATLLWDRKTERGFPELKDLVCVPWDISILTP